MTVPEALRQRNWSMYRLAKEAGLPYSVINNICSNRTKFKNCTVEVAYKISKCLDIPLEDLARSYLKPAFPKEERMDFELFKSYICHRVRDMTDINFIIDVLETGYIRKLYEKKWYPEALYVLAMADYLCRVNKLPVCADYSDIRAQKLSKPIFPASILIKAKVMNDPNLLEESREQAIPEFLRFNIIEREIRNVV